MRTNVIAYYRCSTDDQAEEGLSLQTQRQKIMAYAGLYDLAVVAEYEDPGISAKSYGGLAGTLAHRPGLRSALRMLDRGEADGIVILKLDRLSRSVRDLDELVERYFASRFALLSVTENLDTRSASGRMVLSILAAVAQGERLLIGERTAAALAYKRQCGEFCGGEPPYGWKVGADKVHLIAHNGEQHAITVARSYRKLLSLRKVGAALNAHGIYPRSGGNWHAETVKALVGAKTIDEVAFA
jgi:site-specific DNA recombinase